MFHSRSYRKIIKAFFAIILFCGSKSYGFSVKQVYFNTIPRVKGHTKTETYFYYGSNKTGDAPDSIWNSKIVYRYNKKNDGSMQMYDSQNKVVYSRSSAAYKKESNENHTTKYSVDKNGNNVKMEFSYNQYPDLKRVSNKKILTDTIYRYNAIGAVLSKWVSHKNKKGDIISDEQYNDSGRVIETETYTYNYHHNLLSEIRVDSIGERHMHFYEYDKFGNTVFEKTINDIYIGGWRVGESDITDKNIMYYRLRYSQFDKHNNWQKQECLIKGKAVKKIIRRFEYYD